MFEEAFGGERRFKFNYFVNIVIIDITQTSPDQNKSIKRVHDKFPFKWRFEQQTNPRKKFTPGEFHLNFKGVH